MAIIAALVAAAGSAAIAAGSGAFSGGGSQPQLRDPAADLRSMVRALGDTSSARYALEAGEQPLFGGLNLRRLQEMLLGIEGGPREEEYFETETVPGRPGFGFRDPRRPNSSGFGDAGGGLYGTPDTTRQVRRTRMVDVPRQAGLIEILRQVQPQADEINIDAARRTREADIRDVRELGPRVREAYAAAYPEQEQLLTGLLGAANEDIAAGSNLSPVELRQVQQAIRSGQAERGFGYGPSDVSEEAVATTLEGMGLRNQRLNNARSIAALISGATPDPMFAVTGRPYQSGAAGLLGAGMGGGEGSLQSFLPFFNEAYDYNANATNAANISEGNNRSAVLGSLLGGGGRVGASYFANRRRPTSVDTRPLYGPGY